MSHQLIMKTLELPFKNKLYRFAYSIVGNSFDAEDIIQDLMIKIWKRQEEYKLIENKEAWCMTVTRNLSIDKTRAKKTEPRDINDFHHISDQQATPDRQVEQAEQLSSIMKLVDQLPEKQKMIIHLRDVEGYSYQEIADMTDSTLEFVKVSLHRARKTLKEQLLKQKLYTYES
jgi:RNA polymerase sigma factor (sigma-70 family)